MCPSVFFCCIIATKWFKRRHEGAGSQHPVGQAFDSFISVVNIRHLEVKTLSDDVPTQQVQHKMLNELKYY